MECRGEVQPRRKDIRGVWIVGTPHDSGGRKNCFLVSSIVSVHFPYTEWNFVMFECHYVRSNKSVTVNSNLVKKDPSFPYFRERKTAIKWPIKSK
jgi:hypothetical protein